MKLKELKEIIKNMDDESIVILQKDGEGNGYSPLEGVDDSSNYRADSTWSGKVGYKYLTRELREQGYSDGDIVSGDGAEPAIIFYPVN